MFFPAYRAETTRRGQALNGLLIGLAVVGGFVLTAVIIKPGILLGGHQNQTPHLLETSDRRATLENLAALIASSAEVLAVHQRGAGARGGSPFVEIVLRLHDERGSEFIAPDEVAVLSHSRVLQTVMFYGRVAARDDLLFTREEVAQREFCNQWRLDPAVEPRLLATGVSDLRAEVLHDRTGDRASMRLGLAWVGDSSDAEEEADAVLEVRMRNEQ